MNPRIVEGETNKYSAINSKFNLPRIFSLQSYRGKKGMSKLIRVSDNTFKKIVVLAGKLQAKHKKFASAEDVFEFLFCNFERTPKKFLERMKNK